MKKFITLLLLMGCTRQITQIVVLKFNNQRPVESIPEIYSEWYVDTEECLEKSGDFSAINWHTATEIIFDGISNLGIIEYPNDITIRIGSTRGRTVVRHEMAHHIVGPDREIHFNNGTRALCDGGLEQNFSS